MEGDAELQDLYRDVLLDYFKSASHKGSLAGAQIHSEGVNPLCGDQVRLSVATDGRGIEKARFDGHGCVISQASSAMMAEAIEGKSVQEAERFAGAFRDCMTGKRSFDELSEEWEDLKALEGVKKYPVRIKCALLAWNTLILALQAYKKGEEAQTYQEKEGDIAS